MIKSKNVSNHITVTLSKDDMVYLQRLANLNFQCGVTQGSTSSLASFVLRRYINTLRGKSKRDSLLGLRYYVRVFQRDVPGCELLVCACATLDVARSEARSFDKVYYEVSIFDSDCEMRSVDF